MRHPVVGTQSGHGNRKGKTDETGVGRSSLRETFVLDFGKAYEIWEEWCPPSNELVPRMGIQAVGC